MARKQKELIKAATIATVLDKITNKILGFVVKSNHTEEYCHIQTEIIGGHREFFCDCEAHLWGYDECCHIKAVKEVLVAKAELARAEEEEAAQAAIAEAEAELAEVQASAPKYAPPCMGGFNRRGGAICYISDAEMAALKKVVAARNAAKKQAVPARQYEDWSAPDVPLYTSDRRENATLNPNVGFQLMR